MRNSVKTWPWIERLRLNEIEECSRLLPRYTYIFRVEQLVMWRLDEQYLSGNGCKINNDSAWG